MKKIVCIVLLLASLNSSAQTCEEKQTRLLEAVGGFSSALLYNTYAVIGSISDAYRKHAYTAKMVSGLMEAQKNLADNLVNLLNKLVKDSVLTQTHKDYALAAVSILDGLKEQASLLVELAKDDEEKKQEAYEEQRKKNWSAISKLMGIKE